MCVLMLWRGVYFGEWQGNRYSCVIVCENVQGLSIDVCVYVINAGMCIMCLYMCNQGHDFFI